MISKPAYAGKIDFFDELLVVGNKSLIYILAQMFQQFKCFFVISVIFL